MKFFISAFYHIRIYFFKALLIFSINNINAQDCHCTIKDVEDNTVMACPTIIGVVDTVSTTAALRQAIINANNSGGNMTILIADGTYPIASSAWYPYLIASNLVIRSLSGDRDNVILTGTGMHSVAPGVEIGLFAVGDNITIADLTIRDVGNHGIAATGENLFVHNVRIEDTFEQMLKGTSGDDGADDAVVQCSLFEYTAGVGPQFYIGGLDIHDGDNWIVRDNIFKNIASPSGSLAEHAIHFWNGSSNNTVERNQIINCDRGIGFGLGSSRNDGGIIRNNMIYNDGQSLFHDVGIGLETSPDTKVYHNTIYIEYPNAIEYRFDATRNVEISNNLTNKQIRSRNGGQANLSTNITDARESWFEDKSNGNLRLFSNLNPAYNAAVVLEDVIYDIDQFERPEFGAPDIGAHEVLVAVRTKDELYEAGIFSISPNPARRLFTISSSLSGKYELSVMTISGQLIYRISELNASLAHTVNAYNWKPGLYYCQILHNGARHVQPLIISP